MCAIRYGWIAITRKWGVPLDKGGLQSQGNVGLQSKGIQIPEGIFALTWKWVVPLDKGRMYGQ